MPWIITTGRPSGRFEAVDRDDDEYLLNGFACAAEIRAFTISCPACGAPYEVRAQDARPPAFDRQEQRFRCPRCRFTAGVRLVVDCGLAPDESERGAVQ